MRCNQNCHQCYAEVGFLSVSDPRLQTRVYNDANPKSLNLYSYVENNPTKNVDHDGHCVATPLDGAICIGAGVAIAELGKNIWQWKVDLDRTRVLGAYRNAMSARIKKICENGASQECEEALKAYEGAERALTKQTFDLIKSSQGLPGAAFGGPPPSSKLDLFFDSIKNFFVQSIESSQGSPQDNKRQEKAKEVPRVPKDERKPCLLHRD